MHRDYQYCRVFSLLRNKSYLKTAGQYFHHLNTNFKFESLLTKRGHSLMTSHQLRKAPACFSRRVNAFSSARAGKKAIEGQVNLA